MDIFVNSQFLGLIACSQLCPSPFLKQIQYNTRRTKIRLNLKGPAMQEAPNGRRESRSFPKALLEEKCEKSGCFECFASFNTSRRQFLEHWLADQHKMASERSHRLQSLDSSMWFRRIRPKLIRCSSLKCTECPFKGSKI